MATDHRSLRKSIRVCLVLGCLGLLSGGTCLAGSKVPLGQVIDNLTFKDIRYLHRTLSDLGESRATVIVFLNPDCPVSQQFLPRLVELEAQYAPQGAQFLGVYASPGQSIMDMASHALEHGLRLQVVKDEDQSVCAALGVDHAAEAVVLDGQRRLVYRGRINDQYRPGGTQPKATREDLALAIEDVLAGRAVAVAETPVDGCAISPLPPLDTTQTVTFHKDVEPILQSRCQRCHHQGTPAPFSLVTYQEAADHSEMVAEVTRDGRMPPWYASEKYGHFRNAPGMTAVERETVALWVQAGCPQGSQADAPPPVEFADSEWRIGEPDLKVTMSKPNQIPAEGFIPYQYVILPHIFKEDTYVAAIEILPHNRDVVHHCNMAYGSLSGAKWGRDTFITGYVPGGQPMDLRPRDPADPKVAYKIPKGSSLLLQIHYTVTGKPEESTISVGFKFAGGKVDKLTHFCVLDPRGFSITPGDPLYELSEEAEIPRNATLLGMFTHMHLRGRDMTFTAHRPGSPAETLLQIPNYNFEWQLGYECANKIPAGTKIKAVAHFDNSKFNVYNPDATRAVPYGDQSFDEMFNGFVFWIYDDEDLNLTIDPQTGHVVDAQASAAR